MSERTAIENARRNRRRRFGRRMLGQKQKQAVSPVVATLILILVAVAAAAALYLWLNGWQTGITNGIGSPNAHATITIGGSTSVYPWDQFAVAQFQQNNSNIVVSDNQGGSGAGMLAVCSGAVQIGATSSLQTPSNLETNYGCPQGATNAPVVTTVAYDGVDLVTPVANTHGLVSMSQDTLLTIYIQQSSSAATVTGFATHTLDGVFTAPAGSLNWNEIPACVLNQANCGGAGNPTEVLSLSVGAGIACPVGGATLICVSGGGASPCGFAVCAGGAANPIQTVQRSDNSGTTQSFTARLLQISNQAVETSLSAELNNWGGCGSDGQLSSCGIAATFASLGNPGVIATVASHPDALGYASDGLARVGTSGVSCQGATSGSACGIGFEGVGQTVSIQASLGTSGTIASSIVTGMTPTTGYAGWRPFQWVTLGPATGEVAQLETFVLDPYNNFNFATEANEISIYSV